MMMPSAGNRSPEQCNQLTCTTSHTTCRHTLTGLVETALSEASLCGVSDLVCYGLTYHFTYYGEFWKLVQNTQSSQPIT